jgi:hypothetical protein
MLKDSPNGQTNYCAGCEAAGKENAELKQNLEHYQILLNTY